MNNKTTRKITSIDKILNFIETNKLKEISNDYSKMVSINVDTLVEEYEKKWKDKNSNDKSFTSKYITWSKCEIIGNIIYKDFDVYLDKYEYLPSNSVMVRISMNINGKIYCEEFPVKNSSHKGIINPDSREVSDSIQRGFAKLFSRKTGLGLSLWLKEEQSVNDDYNKGYTKSTGSRTTPLATSKQVSLIHSLYQQVGNIETKEVAIAKFNIWFEAKFKKETNVMNIEEASGIIGKLNKTRDSIEEADNDIPPKELREGL